MAFIPCINHDISTGDVNLLQVAGFIKGSKHARHHVQVAMKSLQLPIRQDKKISGVGKLVIVGTYDEALAVATHMNATNEQVFAVKEALKGLGESNRIPDERFPEIQSEENAMEFDEVSARALIISCLETKANFPIVFDERWSSYMGYAYHADAIKRIEGLIEKGSFIHKKHYVTESYLNLNTGRTLERYRMSKRGIRSFFMTVQTVNGMRFREYYLDLEEEYDSIVPELKKTQAENDRLQEELERLRKEKEIASDYQRWRASREDGIAAHHSAMDRLKHIVGGINEVGSAKLYAIVNDAINKAVLDFQESTTAFKANKKYDRSLSVPDILDDMALRERQSIVERFMRYFAKEGDFLRQLPLDVVVNKVYEFAGWQRLANVKAGDLKDEHLLTNEEAKIRKRKRKDDMKVERLSDSTNIIKKTTVNKNTIVNAKQATINNYFATAHGRCV